jgi:hypothetical protein
MPFQRDGAPEDLPISSEAAPPERLAQHHHALGAALVLPRRKGAADARPDAQHPRQAGRHLHGGERLRLPRYLTLP